MNWEYKVIEIHKGITITTSEFDVSEMEKMMKTLGQDGWELVTSFSNNGSVNGSTIGAILMFKREKR
jgi:Domain of unknown function (DUF4177)